MTTVLSEWSIVLWIGQGLIWRETYGLTLFEAWIQHSFGLLTITWRWPIVCGIRVIVWLREIMTLAPVSATFLLIRAAWSVRRLDLILSTVEVHLLHVHMLVSLLFHHFHPWWVVARHASRCHVLSCIQFWHGHHRVSDSRVRSINVVLLTGVSRPIIVCLILLSHQSLILGLLIREHLLSTLLLLTRSRELEIPHRRYMKLLLDLLLELNQLLLHFLIDVSLLELVLWLDHILTISCLLVTPSDETHTVLTVNALLTTDWRVSRWEVASWR